MTQFKLLLMMAGVIAVAVPAGVAAYVFSSREDEVFCELLCAPRTLLYDDIGMPWEDGKLEGYLHRQARLVTYPFVITSALRDESVAKLEFIAAMEDPAAELEALLNVSTILRDDTGFIRISLPNHVPAEDAATLINALAKSFRREVIDRDRQMLLSRCEDMLALLRKEQAELDKLVDDVERQEAELGQARIEQMAKLQKQNRLAEELIRQKVQLMRLKAIDAAPSSQAEQPNTADVSSPDVANPSEEIRRQEFVIDQLSEELANSNGSSRPLEALAGSLERAKASAKQQRKLVDDVAVRTYQLRVELGYQEEHPSLIVKRSARPPRRE